MDGKWVVVKGRGFGRVVQIGRNGCRNGGVLASASNQADNRISVALSAIIIVSRATAGQKSGRKGMCRRPKAEGHGSK